MLNRVFPDENLPTVIRVSSLSILSSCAEADLLSILPWTSELFSANIDLVQLESVPDSSFRPNPEPVTSFSKSTGSQKNKVVLIEDEEEGYDDGQLKEEGTTTEIPKPRITDDEPTENDSKHPAIRRSALTFLGHLILAILERQAEEDGTALADHGIDRPLDEGEFRMRLPGQITAMSHPVEKAAQQSLTSGMVERGKTVLGYIGLTDEDEVVRQQAKEVDVLLSQVRVVQTTSEQRSLQRIVML